MKNISLLILFVVLLTYSAYAQKYYVACPKQGDTKPHAGFLDKQSVDLVISDSRVIPSNSMIECQGNDIKQMLKNFLQSEFPSCTITLLPDTLYNKASNPHKITIKLGITAYQAVLSKTEWTGSVNYHVMIFDDRTGRAKQVSEDISNDTSKPGIWEYKKTAKTCLFTSFGKSNQDLVSFIEKSLAE
ncbi:MAG: hypothetical protein JSU01_21685 [Bacteroidetes bacterium]|nr:hypothetical protein [Bacteroidota bacterium]